MTEQTAHLIGSLAWPIVGILALIYVWRTDVITKLIKISEAAKDIRSQIKDLIDVEEKLRQSSDTINQLTTTINLLQSDFVAVKADIENIQDRVDEVHGRPSGSLQVTALAQTSMPRTEILFSEMNQAWQRLNEILSKKFGLFDGRSTGSEAYRFAHGNRKGLRLSYDQAGEIARLHSTIKSYRRRQASLSEWLTLDIQRDFIRECDILVDQIKQIQLEA